MSNDTWIGWWKAEAFTTDPGCLVPCDWDVQRLEKVSDLEYITDHIISVEYTDS